MRASYFTHQRCHRNPPNDLGVKIGIDITNQHAAREYPRTRRGRQPPRPRVRAFAFAIGPWTGCRFQVYRNGREVDVADAIERAFSGEGQR